MSARKRSSFELMSIRDIENQLRKYIADAVSIAAGGRFGATSCYLEGIESPSDLAPAIKELGAAYLKKLRAIAKADPVVRGDTISIFGPKPAAEANAPSIEDEAFLSACRKQLLNAGFVRASDADTYEQIAKKYPGQVCPERVRGSEAKRWRELHDVDVVTKRIRARGIIGKKK